MVCCRIRVGVMMDPGLGASRIARRGQRGARDRFRGTLGTPCYTFVTRTFAHSGDVLLWSIYG